MRQLYYCLFQIIKQVLLRWTLERDIGLQVCTSTDAVRPRLRWHLTFLWAPSHASTRYRRVLEDYSMHRKSACLGC